MTASLIDDDFVPLVLGDWAASLVPHNLWSRASGDPAGEANLVALCASQISCGLKKSWGQGRLLRVPTLAADGRGGAPKRGIWLKLRLTAWINIQIS